MQIEEKKIMFVVPSLRGGGAEKVAATLLDSLAKSDDNLKVIVILLHKEAVRITRPNIEIICLDVRDAGNIFHPMFKFLRVMYLLARIIRHVRPRTIISFMDYLNVASIISTRLSGVRCRVVLTVHTLLASYMLRYADNYREKILRRLVLLTYKRADAIIAVSQGVRDDLVNIFRVAGELVHVVHNPVDIDRIRSLSRETVHEKLFSGEVPVILSAGRLVKEKGFDCLIKSFSRLQQRCNARLVILGEGNEEENLRALSRELGIAEDVILLGYQDNPYKYMKHADIFVLPSRYEGFGIVIVEAMACGVPVVATKSYKGIEEIIEDERSGLLVPVADEDALAGAMFRLISYPEEKKRFIGNASEKLGKFSAEHILEKYKTVLLG